MIVIDQCVLCGAQYQVEIRASQFKRWQDGEYIQGAMPDMDVYDREFLNSQICPRCFRELESDAEDWVQSEASDEHPLSPEPSTPLPRGGRPSSEGERKS